MGKEDLAKKLKLLLKFGNQKFSREI